MATYEFSFWYKRSGDTEWQRHFELIEADTDDEAKDRARYPLVCQLLYRAQLQKVEQPEKKKNTLAWKPISYSR